MPKSKKRRNSSPKSMRKDIHRALTAPLPAPRPKHPGYDQVCSDDVLIKEFGEEGADWLQEEYGHSLTVADFQFETCIRKDAFVLDNPFKGPETVMAEEISKMVETAAMVIVAMARRRGVLTDAQVRELAEIEAMDPVDHAAEGVDVVRKAFQDGTVFLNDRSMWDLSEMEEQHV